MKVVAISDLHGYLPNITDPADLMLIVGDIMPLSIQFNKPKSLDWLSTVFTNWAQELPVDQIILVAGNHDAVFENISVTSLTKFKEINKGKLVYLQNESFYYQCKNGLIWHIFGTPYCKIFGNWPFMRGPEILTEKFKEIPDKADIIMSHDPPFNFGDIDVVFDRPELGHLGNLQLAVRLSSVNYSLLVSGHIHSGDHNFNETFKCANVSILNEQYRPFYKPFYIELKDEENLGILRPTLRT